jgi:hypothetical protein
MLHFAAVLGVVSPMVLDHGVVRFLRFWLWAGFRCAAALTLAAVIYLTVMLIVVQTCPPGHPMAHFLYGLGLALATVLGVFAAMVALPAGLARGAMIVASSLAMALPLSVCLNGAHSGGLPVLSLWYLTAALAGGIAANRIGLASG